MNRFLPAVFAVCIMCAASIVSAQQVVPGVEVRVSDTLVSNVHVYLALSPFGNVLVTWGNNAQLIDGDLRLQGSNFQIFDWSMFPVINDVEHMYVLDVTSSSCRGDYNRGSSYEHRYRSIGNQSGDPFSDVLFRTELCWDGGAKGDWFK